MAIYVMKMQVGGRSSGRTSVASAAYRAGCALEDERLGQTYDYSRKRGVIYSSVMLPEEADEKYLDRAVLWNAVEAKERRKDAQLFRECCVALPVELSEREQIQLVRTFVAQQFVAKGMACDINIHDTGRGNPHAHLMLTLRGFENGELSTKKNRDWNTTSQLEEWREQWELHCNQYLSPESQISSKRLDLEDVKEEVMSISAELIEVKKERGIKERLIEALRRARDFSREVLNSLAGGLPKLEIDERQIMDIAPRRERQLQR